MLTQYFSDRGRGRKGEGEREERERVKEGGRKRGGGGEFTMAARLAVRLWKRLKKS